MFLSWLILASSLTSLNTKLKRDAHTLAHTGSSTPPPSARIQHSTKHSGVRNSDSLCLQSCSLFVYHLFERQICPINRTLCNLLFTSGFETKSISSPNLYLVLAYANTQLRKKGKDEKIKSKANSSI